MIQAVLKPVLIVITCVVGLPFAGQGTASAHAGPASQVLWYTRPAQDWKKEALPIGNGRLGAMVFGGIDRERIQFNEDSLWIGDEGDTGAYQAFGDLYIDFADPSAARLSLGKSVADYRRELDISRSLHTITYRRKGVNYRREYFASHPAQVMVFRFSADKEGAYTGTIALADAHKAVIMSEGNRIIATGSLAGYAYDEGSSSGRTQAYDLSLYYEAQVLVLHEGGAVTAAQGNIAFKNCDSLTVMLAADTDYLNQRDKGWRGAHPHARLSAQLATAARTPYAQLRAAHVQDYQTLFNRLNLDLGVSLPERRSLPSDERIKAFGDDNAANTDPELEALYFQYARYLMISSSRAGALPANLQGLWNHSNKPPWRSDYHSDVNIQMNYWFVDQVNLSECFGPLAEWLYSIRSVRRDETNQAFGTRGWMTHSENGIFGGSSYHWVPGDASWMAQNLWDHYAYTQDRDYLRTRAYPIMKELCEFWQDYLVEGADGKLVSRKSQSPEHGPWAQGNSYDQQLAWDVFTNTIEAAQALGVDAEFRQTVTELKARLLGPQIGKWGQLQEWAADIDDPNDKHRHLSHLIAVYPGRQISLQKTPALAQAAAVSLDAQGDGAAGWSISWKAALWARLGDGNRAYRILKTKTRLHRDGVFPNLLSGVWDVFQIEAHFGYCAAACEMMVQSHLGEIHLLPALPDAWPEGSVKGLRVRGAASLDIAWQAGKLQEAVLQSDRGGVYNMRYGDKVKTISLRAGGSRRLTPAFFHQAY